MQWHSAVEWIRLSMTDYMTRLANLSIQKLGFAPKTTRTMNGRMRIAQRQMRRAISARGDRYAPIASVEVSVEAAHVAHWCAVEQHTCFRMASFWRDRGRATRAEIDAKPCVRIPLDCSALVAVDGKASALPLAVNVALI